MKTLNTYKKISLRDTDQSFTNSERVYAKLIYPAIKEYKAQNSQVDVLWNSFIILETNKLVSFLKKKIKTNKSSLYVDFLTSLTNKNSFKDTHKVYRPDFICPKYGLVIEIDGHSHEHPEIHLEDKFKNILYEDYLGYTLIRFENYNNIQNVRSYLKNLIQPLAQTNKHVRRLQHLRCNAKMPLENPSLHNWMIGKGFSSYHEGSCHEEYNTDKQFSSIPTQTAFGGFRTSIGLKMKPKKITSTLNLFKPSQNVLVTHNG